MAESQESPQNTRAEAQALINEASDFLKQRQQARLEQPAVEPDRIRRRASLAGLVVSFPILVILIALNLTGWDIGALLEPTPSPSVAAQEARRTLDGLVSEVEAYGKDYGELPQVLAEVGMPARGSWTYTVTSDGRYSIRGTLYGQSVSHQSTKPVEPLAREEEEQLP